MYVPDYLGCDRFARARSRRIMQGSAAQKYREERQGRDPKAGSAHIGTDKQRVFDMRAGIDIEVAVAAVF